MLVGVRLLKWAGWEVHNQRIGKMIVPLAPEQLRLRSASGIWPVSILAAHVIGARAFLFHEIMRVLIHDAHHGGEISQILGMPEVGRIDWWGDASDVVTN